MSAQVEIEPVGKLKTGNPAIWLLLVVMTGGSGFQFVSVSSMQRSWDDLNNKIVTRDVFELSHANLLGSIEGLRTDLRQVVDRERPMATRLAVLEGEVQELRRQLDEQRK